MVDEADYELFSALVGTSTPQAVRFLYDGENRLSIAYVPGFILRQQIYYDALGRRIFSVDYDSEGTYVKSTRHYYDGLAVVAEVECGPGTGQPNCGPTYAPALAREFLWGSSGISEPGAQATGSSFPHPLVMIDHTAAGDVGAGVPETLYYVHDALGSVVGLLDQGGVGIPARLVERYDYDPYGTTYISCRDPNAPDPNSPAAFVSCESSHYGNPFLWTAQRYDAAVGLYHFLFRTYSPTLGRWMQTDPIGYINGPNLYQYVSSRPLLFIDPRGLEQVCNLDVWLFFGRRCVDRELYEAALDERAKDVHDRTQGTIDGTTNVGTGGLVDIVDEVIGVRPGDILGPTFDEEVRESAKNTSEIISAAALAAIAAASLLKNGASVTDDVVACVISYYCLSGETIVQTTEGPQRVAAVSVGERVTLDAEEYDAADWGDEDAEAELAEDAARYDLDDWRVVTLAIGSPESAEYVEIQTIERASDAAEMQRSFEGGVLIATPTGEVLGRARVASVEPCPLPDGGDGFLVTASVSRVVDEVLAITLSCALEPLIATADHRFYSEDRSGWVAAGDLRPGERLRSRWGPCFVTCIEVRREPTRVCDITVAGVHAFYAGEGGVLTHNGKKCGKLTKQQKEKWRRRTSSADERVESMRKHQQRNPYVSKKKAEDRAKRFLEDPDRDVERDFRYWAPPHWLGDPNPGDQVIAPPSPPVPGPSVPRPFTCP